MLRHKLKTRIKGWSPEKDREFHDRHFAAQNFDPFHFGYPGYITIRRFADLVTPFLEGCQRVLDVGCGPAEITCELASRFPRIEFVGIDHSTEGIERARQNAELKKIDNASFRVADAETFSPEEPFDLVTLFDAFHHMMDPAAFIRRLGPKARRFVLIEPQGDWKGGWKRDLDFDWLLLELDKIRLRADYMTGAEQETPPEPGPGPGTENEAVEQRFTLQDFQRFFKGYTLRIQGSISGLDSYPPGGGSGIESRELFGRMAYEFYKSIDERLFRGGLDFAAKHWIICAEKGGTLESRLPVLAPVPVKDLPPIDVAGPYDIAYLEHDAPEEIVCGAEIQLRIRFRNRSYRIWAAGSEKNPEQSSYHWWDRRKSEVIRDGIRTPLPGPVQPGEEGEVGLRVVAPGKPGRYFLAVDFVREGEAWFSDFGAPCLVVPFHVVRK